MIKKTMFIATMLLTMSLNAQEQPEKTNQTTSVEDNATYKLAVNKGKLQINLGKATIEGYDGKEIVFSAKKTKESTDERAKGLRAINAMGLTDNTGLGINVEEKNGVIDVKQLSRINPPNIKILVPRGVTIVYEHQSQFGSTVTFKNIENELEASVSYNSIVLENITGPATINSIYGSIDARFSQNVKGPLSVVSIYGAVDVSIPKKANANIKVTTSYGDILVAPELPIKMQTNSDMIKYNDQLSATLNAGGSNFNFRSDYGKIYLRAL
ncbi:DUF4097 family beta strand repeat-containing protein [Algoriella sp.]|uniref:DUF4097 family beta strand repeat-containing protein n=2 Tax=Algoriella sp. TaxID=1872434 RepID=UPI002FC77689